MLRRALLLFVVSACTMAWGQAPQAEGKSGPPPPKNPAPPRSEPIQDPNESSSRETIGDIRDPDALPPDMEEGEEPESDVQEMHQWNPHRAEKCVEIGDYYMRRKNYRAAESRYREALDYKPNDAVASFRLAVVLEKTGEKDEARELYEQYLKILPQGPLAGDARKALERLQTKKSPPPKQATKTTSPPAENHP